jgi:hypothetical protein
MGEKITVELTEEDNETLLFLQKNFKNIKKLEDSGVFEIRAKTVHLHIDPLGYIKDIDFIIRHVDKLY